MRLRSADWRLLATWVAGFVLAGFFLGWVIRAESERELRRGTQQTGVRWAQLASVTVPDLALALSGDGVTPAAREQLQILGRSNGVFRFKLFDPLGRRVLLSDDLALPGALPPPMEADGIGHGPQGAASLDLRAKVLAGNVHSEVIRETRPGRPAVYGETYVPVLGEGKVLGVVEVYVDQTELAASIRQAVWRVLGALVLVLLLLLGVAGHQVWQRMRQQRGVQARVRYMAHHDALSGALNRASFTEVLEKAAWRRAEGGPSFSLLCIDLDRFKEVNDSMGHAAGDEVLRLATQRLKDAVREGDQVARLGGDEFAILLPGIASVEAVTPLAQRVVQALALPFEVGAQRVRCGGSVGIAIHGLDATDPDDLLGKADLALYRAKADGRGTFSFYDVAMDRQMQARRELTRDLRGAIAGDQLALFYQPLYGNDGVTLTGYEALLRWQHPGLGSVPPVEFIPLAEETGLIESIGQWVLQRACKDAAAWPDPLTVAVNLSAAQFTSGDLVGAVKQALAESGLEACRLELEITESLLMNNTDEVLGTLRALADMGVPIAMDDFGTGYSSLAYLWRFPFDKVKIDRAFTHNLGHDAKVGLIVRSIITLAHSLDIRVNAEGVETPSQMAALQEHGCDELQGFLLGRPRPAQSLTHKGRALPDSVHGRQPARGSLFAELDLDMPNSRPMPLI
jgi:diguanylate cyclase (GGDEF)-like protein